MTADTSSAPTLGAEIIVEEMSDRSFRVAVRIEGKLYDAVTGFGTFDEAMAAAEDFREMALSIPGVQEAKLQ